MHVHPLVTEWAASKPSATTRVAYLHAAKQWMSWLPVELLEADRDHGEAWRDLLVCEGKSPRTINRSLSTVASLYAWLADNGHINRSPMQQIKRQPIDRHWGTTTPVSLSSVGALLAYAEQTSARFHISVALMLTGAVRDSDLLTLTASNFVQVGDAMTLQLGIGGHVATLLPVPTGCLGSVATLVAAHPTGQLLSDEDGSPWSYWRFHRALKAAAKSVGIAEEITPQVLRSTWAVLAIEIASTDAVNVV